MEPATMFGVASIGLRLLGSASQSAQQRAAAKAQYKWDKYNAQMSYNTALMNADSEAAITQANIANMLATTDLNASLITDSTQFNIEMLQATTEYNNLLVGNEINLLWESTGLDLTHLQRERAVERGSIEAAQAASGVVMGQDSAQVVIIDQRAQENLDAFVVRHGADIQAAKLQRAMAENTWQGAMEAKKMRWEGEQAVRSMKIGAALEATTMTTQSSIRTAAAKRSGASALTAGLGAASSSYSAGKQYATNTLTNGLFTAAADGAKLYYASKLPSARTTAAPTSISAPDPGKFSMGW